MHRNFQPLAFGAGAAILILTSSTVMACPTINGSYKRVVETETKFIIHRQIFSTRRESGVVSYTTDGKQAFQRADGIARPLRVGDRIGKITLSCRGNTLSITTQEDGYAQVNRVDLTMRNDGTLKVDSYSPGASGIYTKE